MIIPIRKNGRPWKEDCPAARARNETLRATRHYSRVFWKRWTGYHTRSRAEARMPSKVSLKPVALDLFDLKSFGERIAAIRHCRSDRWRSNGSLPDRPLAALLHKSPEGIHVETPA